VENPYRLKKLFLSTEINNENIYGVKLCLNGKWTEIIVDDYFPCDPKKSLPCFSYCNDNSLWLKILEKCYAKSRGSYYLLEKGSYDQTIKELTGAPIIIIDNSNELLLANIKKAYSKKWIITASAGETEASRELLGEVGLIPLHTYIVYDIFDLSQFDEIANFPLNMNNSKNISSTNLSNSNYDNILKIRNPWGKNEWIGDWSDYSNLWREDIKQKLNYSKSEHSFYMNFKDFKHYFSKIQICKIHDNFIYNSLTIKQSENSYTLIKIKISNNDNIYNNNINNSENFYSNEANLNNDNNNSSDKNKIYISVIQNEIRKNIFNIEKKYSIARMILSKLIYDNDNLNKINENNNTNEYESQYQYEVDYLLGKISQEKDLFFEKDLEPGEYILLIEVDKPIDKKNMDINNDMENCLKFNRKIFNKGNDNFDYNLNNNNNENKFMNMNISNNFKPFSLNGKKKDNENYNDFNEFLNNNINNNPNKNFMGIYHNLNEENFVVSTYSYQNVELEKLRNEDFPNILQKIYISCAKKDNNVLRFTNDGAPNCLK
jgi:hypothetical protein